MKKIFLITFLSFGITGFAQFKDNAFESGSNLDLQQEPEPTKSDDAVMSNTKIDKQPVEFDATAVAKADTYTETSTNPQGRPGNPGPPVPIDDYLPILMIAAVGFAGYYQSKKRKISF